MKQLSIFGLMIGLFLSACAPNPVPPVPFLPAPTLAPNPLTVQARIDTAQSNSALITIQGGTLSAIAADGTKFTLTLPKDALLQDIEITLTPVSQIEGLPLSGGLVAAVQIEPDSLELLRPGTLTIEMSKALPSDDLRTVGFAYEGNGKEFHLTPTRIEGQTITFSIYHFSGRGSGRGTKVNMQQQKKDHPPTKPQARIEQDVSDVTPEDVKPLLDYLYIYGIGPQINAAVEAERKGGASADAVLKQALAAFEAWLKAVKANDLEGQFEKEIDVSYRLLVQAIKYALDDAYKGCVEKDDIEQSLRMDRWLNVWVFFPSKYTGDISAYEAKRDECYHHFALEIKEITTGSIQDVTYGESGKYKLPIALQRGGTFTGEATGTATAPNCNLVTQSTFQVQTIGRLDTGAHVLNTKISITSKVLTGTATCGGMSGSATNSIPGIAPEFNIPSHTGNPVKITTAIPGGSWEIGGTLIANR